MNNFEEIRYALSRLNNAERRAIIAWLQRSNELLYGADRVEESRPAYVSQAPEYMTREEFLELQERSPIPYEYVNGIIRQMSAPSVAHCRVTQSLFDGMRSRLRGSPCETFCAGLQLNLTLEDDEIVYKPDLFVVCESQGWGKNWIANPKLVVEVLSPSTQYIDRREKLVNYCRVPSLDEYVIASQKRAEFMIYRRAGDWRPESVTDLRSVVEFRSLGIAIPLVEIYDDVFSGPAVSVTEN
jgi:Uma2 family endonuclease